MNTITQCPQCATRFKVSQAQLEAHQGMVRCGRCQAVFNASQHVHDDQPSPQLSLPIELPPDLEPAPSATATDNTFDEVAPARPSPSDTLTQQFSDETTSHSTKRANNARQVAGYDFPVADEVLDQPGENKLRWPWVVGAVLVLALLLAQAGYFFRDELAARLPGLKPVLTSYCNLLKCSILLPQKADLLSIESSDLEADPAHASVIDLNAILRNRAPYTQAYPHIELTLTDLADAALARRIFLPSQYLKPGEEEKQGLAASRELSIKLHLDTTDLKPTGYRLFLFYP